MVVVRRLGVLSVGKVLGALYGAMGLLFGALFSLISLIGAGAALSGGDEGAMAGLIFGIGAVIFLPIFYGILGFLFGMLMSWIYNLVAGVVGGIEVELDPPPGAPVAASYSSASHLG